MVLSSQPQSTTNPVIRPQDASESRDEGVNAKDGTFSGQRVSCLWK
jgi:hypothetical protein